MNEIDRYELIRRFFPYEERRQEEKEEVGGGRLEIFFLLAAAEDPGAGADPSHCSGRSGALTAARRAVSVGSLTTMRGPVEEFHPAMDPSIT